MIILNSNPTMSEVVRHSWSFVRVALEALFSSPCCKFIYLFFMLPSTMVVLNSKAAMSKVVRHLWSFVGVALEVGRRRRLRVEEKNLCWIKSCCLCQHTKMLCFSSSPTLKKWVLLNYIYIMEWVFNYFIIFLHIGILHLP